MPILNVSRAPREPLRRILWLTELEELIGAELRAEYEAAYFQARQQGQFEAAIEIGPYSRTEAKALTRAHNEKLGRQVRWGAM